MGHSEKGWEGGLGQRVSEIPTKVRGISFTATNVSQLSRDSGQMVQRGPWEQKQLESSIFELTPRTTKLMNGLRISESFITIK